MRGLAPSTLADPWGASCSSSVSASVTESSSSCRGAGTEAGFCVCEVVFVEGLLSDEVATLPSSVARERSTAAAVRISDATTCCLTEGSLSSGVDTSVNTVAKQVSKEHQTKPSDDERDLRESVIKFEMADIRLRLVATRGFVIACLTCVSTLLRAVRATLSTA